MKPKLEIELVPSTAWYSNLRSILTPADWDTVRKLVYKNADYKCEICGGKGEKHPVEAHEVWGYNDSDFDVNALTNEEIIDTIYNKVVRTQKLLYVQALCPICHEAKHIGLAQIRGFGERAKETLMRVNEWDKTRVLSYIKEKFTEWHERSRHQWSINIDKVTHYGIDLSKYKDKLNK